MASIKVGIENVTKRFGKVVAVNDLSLEIQPGELFTLLGPSGCGKTTLLRTIAGFYFQDSGRILFDDSRIDHIPPHKRNTGMVFQSYAIFPFMNVFDNIAYGLKTRRIAKSERRERVLRAIDLVRLNGLEKRRPDQLSGGQQQRVAVARAVVIEPKVLLMDEPLSNLDAKLRVEMRVDIRRMQKQLGITMIYVTHDQEEALAISDRIAVMSTGVVAQVGTPWEIYHSPATPHVAGFIGVSNFFTRPVSSVDRVNQMVGFDFYGNPLDAPCTVNEKMANIVVSVRPEALKLGNPDRPSEGLAHFRGRVFDTTYLGAGLRLAAKTEDDVDFQIEISHPSLADELAPGSEIFVEFSPADVAVFPAGSAVLPAQSAGNDD